MLLCSCLLIVGFLFLFYLLEVCSLHILDSLPVRQRTGLPETTGQLHSSVAQPRHGELIVLNWHCCCFIHCEYEIAALTLLTEITFIYPGRFLLVLLKTTQIYEQHNIN